MSVLSCCLFIRPLCFFVSSLLLWLSLLRTKATAKDRGLGRGTTGVGEISSCNVWQGERDIPFRCVFACYMSCGSFTCGSVTYTRCGSRATRPGNPKQKNVSPSNISLYSSCFGLFGSVCATYLVVLAQPLLGDVVPREVQCRERPVLEERVGELLARVLVELVRRKVQRRYRSVGRKPPEVRKNQDGAKIPPSVAAQPCVLYESFTVVARRGTIFLCTTVTLKDIFLNSEGQKQITEMLTSKKIEPKKQPRRQLTEQENRRRTLLHRAGCRIHGAPGVPAAYS